MEMTKKEEKEIGTLLGVGNAFIPVHTFNGEDYVALFAFKEAIKGLEEENKKLKERVSELEDVSKDYDLLSKDFIALGEENKNLRDYADNLDSENDNQAIEIEELKKENKKLKKYYDRDKEELMESCYSLAKENDELKKENKKLKSELSKNKVERWSLKKDCENKIEQQKIALKSMENQIRELKETLEHRDSVLSIMYDLLRSDLGDYEQLCMIDVVIDVEVGNEPQNKLREELLDRFWKRDF